MIMRNHVVKLASMAGALLGLALPSSLQAASDSTFSFGPPLRPNIVFVYKVTERVKVVNSVAGSEERDSSQRLVTYFISERQQPSAKGSGRLEIVANVDSMRIEYSGLDGTVSFDTQRMPSDKIVRHREVLGPSVVVNRMATFTLSPYGDVVKMESRPLADVERDLREGQFDAFTLDRVRASVTEDAITPILLPWRGLLPNGRTMKMGSSRAMPFVTALDRTIFRDTAEVKLTRSAGDGKPHLTFTSALDRPSSKTTTLTMISDPLKVIGGLGTVTGDLKLDEDGVLLSGWITGTGTVTSDAGAVRVTSVVSHETYVDMIAMSPFAQ